MIGPIKKRYARKMMSLVASLRICADTCVAFDLAGTAETLSGIADDLELSPAYRESFEVLSQ